MKAVEPALTIQDHDAMLAALGEPCPTGLARLRRELLEKERLRHHTEAPSRYMGRQPGGRGY